MRLSKSWTIAKKDFKTFAKKKNIIYSVAIIPVLVSFLLPLVIEYVKRRSNVPSAELLILLPSFAFFFLVLAATIPSTLASYTIVGEKMEKSLEPLLATPLTDSEILLGKGLAAFLPPIVGIMGSIAIFMGLMDWVTHPVLGYNYFPDANTTLVLLVMVPLAVVLSVEWNVIVSARVSDVRIAQQFGILIAIPFGGMYLSGELNIVQLGDTNNLALIAAAILALDILMLVLVRATFRREEILTKWK